MSISQSRVQAGVPTGGQFATSARGEAGLALVEDLDEDFTDLDDLADRVLAADAAADLRARHDEVSQTIQNAYDSARHWERRKGVQDRSRGVMDTDDIAQEAMLAVLEREANGHVIDDTKGYMHTTAWGIANQAGNNAVRAEDRKALKQYRAEVDTKTRALGRPLTPQEQDEIATSIRDNWHDQRRKPSADFRRFMGQMEVSMNAFETAEATDAFLPRQAVTEPGARGVNEVAPGSYMDRALDAVEDHGGTLRDAKRMLYNALAETSDAPLVEAGTLSQRRVTALKATMTDHPGGVANALRQWGEGEDNQATRALFAPWGEGATDSDRVAVADLMERFPDRAEDLWDSALKLANNRNADRV